MTDFTSILTEQLQLLAVANTSREHPTLVTEAKQAILQAVEQLCSEVIGEDDNLALLASLPSLQKEAHGKNILRFTQRKALAAALRGEKV